MFDWLRFYIQQTLFSLVFFIKKLDGVSAAQVNLEEGKVDVTFDESKVTVDKMKEVIEDQGYDVEV